MKVQNSDIKTVADLGGDKTKLINDTQVYVGAAGVLKRLSVAITDGSIGGGASLVAVVNPSSNTYDVSALAQDGYLVHTQAVSALYRLPSANSAAIKSYTFQHRGISPTNSTNIIIDGTNNKVYFFRGSNFTATLASATYTLAGMATEIASKMNAQDANSYTCSFDLTSRSFKLTGSAAWNFTFATNTTNSSATVLAIAQEDSTSATKQNGFSFDNSVIVRPASGDRIRYRGQVVEYPGYISLNKSGMSFRLVSIDNDTWVVDRVVAENHEKNSTIGFKKDVSLVGKDAWVTKANAGTARHLVAGFSLNGFGYICSGTTGSDSNEVNQYNDVANTWATKATAGTARRAPTGFSLNGYGYVCDGLTGAAVNEVSQYNDAINTWATKATGGTARYGLGGFSLNGYGYISSGDTGAKTNEVNKYNDSANTWSTQATSGTARVSPGGFSLNGYGYICNGNDTGVAFLNEVNQYNDSANTWTTKATGGTARYGLASFALNGYGYISSGADGGVYYNQVNEYNDSANTWTTKATAGTARYAPGGFNLNGYGYISSGNDGIAYNEVNQYN